MRKFLFLGDRQTGKTLTATLLCGLPRMRTITPTIGADYYSTVFSAPVDFGVWEVSGDPRCVTLIPNFVDQVDTVVYVCASNVPASINNVKTLWRPNIKSANKREIIVLIDNFICNLHDAEFHGVTILRAWDIQDAAEKLKGLELPKPPPKPVWWWKYVCNCC